MGEKNNFIGNNIKKYRKDNMTQAKLASLIGRSIDTIKKYESGKATPPTEILLKIADSLCVSLDELLDTETTSFSSKLITSILTTEYFSVALESDDDNLKTLSKYADVNIDSLKKCLEENIELPVKDQLKLINFWNEWGCDEDGITLDEFVYQNKTKIKSNPIISNEIKNILNKTKDKTDIEKLLELLKKYGFRADIINANNQNTISIYNSEKFIIAETESKLMRTYNTIINKINSYSKFVIEDELKKL